MLPPYSSPRPIRSKAPGEPMPPELPRRPHFQRRMRMHLVEVLEGRWQLRQYRLRVTPVHARHIVTLEGVDEALGHAVALQAGVLMVFRPSARASALVAAAM